VDIWWHRCKTRRKTEKTNLKPVGSVETCLLTSVEKANKYFQG
jgi:hypothetical protein